jgi:hypothetical protein
MPPNREIPPENEKGPFPLGNQPLGVRIKFAYAISSVRRLPEEDLQAANDCHFPAIDPMSERSGLMV